MFLLLQSLRKTLVLMGADEKLAKACPSVAAVLLAIPMPSHAIDFICTLNPFTQAFRYKAAPAGDDSQPAVKVSACFVPRDQALASVLRTSDEFDGALDRWTKAIQAGSESYALLVVCRECCELVPASLFAMSDRLVLFT